METWMNLDQTYIMHTAKRLPLVVQKAEGNYLFDFEGNRYLDLFTGLGVNIVGHKNPNILHKAEEQLQHYMHLSNYFYNPSAISLAKRLVDNTLGKGKVFFTNSGTEATEAMLKLIHKWTRKRESPKEGIVVLKNSFHGRTLGSLYLTRQENVYQDYPICSIPIFEAKVNEANTLSHLCDQYSPQAILIEPILGSGGVIPLKEEFIYTIRDMCKKKDILLCMDEIQTGMGRTGQLFCYTDFDIQPDILLFAKAVGGGLPLGGMIVSNKLENAFEPGDHGTTFAPSPLATATAHGLLDMFDNGLFEKAKVAIHHIWEKLKQQRNTFPHIIQDIYGKGMMIGIHTHLSNGKLKEMQLSLLKKGFLIDITQQTVIRLLPPLTLTIREIDTFIEAFHNQLKDD